MTFSGRTASQDARELGAFIGLLQSEGVRSYGEIGARDGDTFYAVMLALPKGSTGVALDLPGGKWGRIASRGKLEKAVARLVLEGYKASTLFGDSGSVPVANLFCGRGPYDAILIDGDHRLTSVTRDWETYRSMARIIAFHDIAGDGQKTMTGECCEVPLLWQSIKASGLRTTEFVTRGAKMGIGVVWTR